MKLHKFVRSVGAGVSAVALFVSASVAHAAATPVDLSAPIQQAQTDVSTNGVLVLGVIVACAAIGWIRRILR
ncbi:major capsid protein [Collimonas fungivorans]|uniref:major capsid protein n=1 Tax=Collimonas fungivorans TaxID=158899 RepID=UPI0011D233FF|nr:major capsid protein [Collimonas fungivorans]